MIPPLPVLGYDWSIRAVRPDGTQWSAKGHAERWENALMDVAEVACGEGMPPIHSVQLGIVPVFAPQTKAHDAADCEICAENK